MRTGVTQELQAPPSRVNHQGKWVRSKWGDCHVPDQWLTQAKEQLCLGKVKGQGISIVACNQPLLTWRDSQTRCRACQEWQNAQYAGKRVLCVCSAGKPPGKCPTCAPDEHRLARTTKNETRKLKRKGLWQAGYKRLLDINKWPCHVF